MEQPQTVLRRKIKMYPNNATKPATADSGTLVDGVFRPEASAGIPSEVTAFRVGSIDGSGALPGSDSVVDSKADDEASGPSAADKPVRMQAKTRTRE